MFRSTIPYDSGNRHSTIEYTSECWWVGLRARRIAGRSAFATTTIPSNDRCGVFVSLRGAIGDEAISIVMNIFGDQSQEPESTFENRYRRLHLPTWKMINLTPNGAWNPQMEGRLLGAFPVSLTVNINISLPPNSHARPVTQQPSIERLKLGESFVEGTNPNGTRYRGNAFISPVGERDEFAWDIGGKKHFGRGVISGNTLYVNWGTNPDELDGLITYSMEENSVLKGVWANGKGTETLVPK